MADVRLTKSQVDLLDYMSELSELAYCAGWMDQTEYRLWAFITDMSDDGSWGLITLTAEVRDRLSLLNKQAGGWIRWVRPGDAGNWTGEVFITEREWREEYSQWKQRSAERATS